ncbi:hypothetical protein [Desulfovibrio sp. TomC]|uniref:hypothetical protein n=1 Tax=Desulfovibrio sp. TomC TaxID=1562888 RepID=UPI0022B17E87|nr:hypothetical protein [Desulfovibrio sp. TomC]
MRKLCLQEVCRLAKERSEIVFIGSDLGVGTLDEFHQAMPERFFMEGISEANVVGMAAGMALSGKIPYVNTIASFLTRRAYEQIAIDVCLHNARVRLIGNGGGWCMRRWVPPTRPSKIWRLCAPCRACALSPWPMPRKCVG